VVPITDAKPGWAGQQFADDDWSNFLRLTATSVDCHLSHWCRSRTCTCGFGCTVSIRLYDTLAHLVNCPGCWIVAD